MAEYIVEKKKTSGGWTWAEPKGKLIRCKECKHFIIDESKECVLLGCTRYCSYHHDCTVTESDFCSRAERKEE